MTTKKKTLTAKDGTKLTPNAVGQLADEAEAGYDLSKGRRRRGRPRLGAGVGPSQRVTFRADEELIFALKELAIEQGRKVSDVARDAAQIYVKSDNAKIGMGKRRRNAKTGQTTTRGKIPK